MKLILKIVIIFILTIFVLDAKSKKGVIINTPLPQIIAPSNSGLAPLILPPGLNPYFYNSPAYGNLLLNQYNANMNAITSRIPQPQSDLGAQYLDKHIQKEIADDITVQPIQSSTSMPTYRITNINDHGRAGSKKDSKFKNVDYLLWKFQNIEEGIPVRIKGNQLELAMGTVFTDKPDSLLAFVRKEKESYLLLESRSDGILTGLLVNARTKKTVKVQCSKVKMAAEEIYEYALLAEEGELWNYLALFEN